MEGRTNRRVTAKQDHPAAAALAGARLRLLLAEDSDEDAELVLRELKRAALDCECRRVQTAADFERELQAFRPQVILSDFAMPGFSGLAALRIWRRSGLDVPFIFVSGTIGEDVAIEAVKAGAHDYVMKTNLVRLAHLKDEVFAEGEPTCPARSLTSVSAGIPVDEILASDDRQPHAEVLVRISDQRLGLAAAGHGVAGAWGPGG